MCLEKDMISAYCDGETSGKVKALIEAHLNECAECRRIAETYRFVSQAVRRCGEEPDAAKVRAFAVRLRSLNRKPAPVRLSFHVPALRAAVFLFAALLAFTFILFSVIIFAGGSRNGEAVMASAPAERAVAEPAERETAPYPTFRPDNRNLRTVDY